MKPFLLFKPKPQSLVWLGLFLLLSQITKAQVSGTVFRDFNANGVKDTNEPLVSGVTVNAYLANSTSPCGTTTSSGNAAPNYTLSGCGTAAVRLEFVWPSSGTCANSGIDFSANSGATYGSSVQFVNGNSANVNFAINNPADYNTGMANTKIFIPIASKRGDPLGSTSISNGTWFAGYNYNASGSGAPTQTVNGAIIGTTWGVAYSKQAQKIFTSALVKRHVGLGALGSGGIYMLTPTATSFTINSFYDLDANGHRTRAASSAVGYGAGSSFTVNGAGTQVTYNGPIDALSGEPE